MLSCDSIDYGASLSEPHYMRSAMESVYRACLCAFHGPYMVIIISMNNYMIIMHMY